MSGASTLCVWPPAADATGCCAAPAAVPATVPLPIDNAPGLSAIGYRIGTFTSFRQAMLDQVATPDLLFLGVSTTLTADAAAAATTIQVADFTAFPGAAPFRIKIDSEYLLVVSGAGTTLWTVVRGVDGSSAAVHTADDPVLLVPANPFAAWHAGVAGDYQTMFVELWAYLADVLTFYQERIANEAFMGTAALTDSVRRLAELVDSQPSPGAGATGLVSYTVARGQTTTVAAGLRVGSRATPTAPAVTFETATALTALGDYSAMPVAANAFVDQFAPLSGTAIIRQIVLAGTALGLRIGDFVVAVCNERLGALEVARAFRLQSVSVDRSSGTTTIAWSEFVPTTYDETRVPVSLYALSVTAGVFGNSAPAYAGLPPALTSPSATSPPYAPPYADNWDQQTDPAAWVGYPGSSIPPTPAVPANALDLDGVYDAVRASPEIPGWAVVVTGDTLPTAGVTTQNLTPSATAMLFHVTAAKAVSRTGYTLNARVTRLSLGTSEQIPSRIFPIRATTVLAGTSALVVQSLPLPVGGTSITLTGVFDQLQPGQTVIIQGPLNIGGQLAAESHVLAGPPQVNATLGTTVIALTTPLANQYVAAGTVVLGNVVAVTQGETVRDEQLGNGAGTPYQSFVLKKTPLTYLPSTNSAGLTAVADTLTVTVNGVAWTEVQSLLGQGADAQVFLTSTDDQQQTTVLFGDGINGAMPPTGVGNVHARYRRGLGASGNLPAGSLVQMIDSAPGLQGVTNPLPTTGGADPPGLAQLRQTTAGSLVTFGRAVSADDYAALALQFPGITKATANWVLRGPDGRPVPIPYMQLNVAVADGTPIAGSLTASNLRGFLDSYRDTNIPLRILDFTPVPIDVSVTVDILPQYPKQATLTAIEAALNPGINPDGSAGYFAFANTSPGVSVHLSTVYAAVQSIPGVADAIVTVLRPAGSNQAVWDTIFVRPTEIVEIGNVAGDPSQGTLLVTYGSGGFADQ